MRREDGEDSDTDEEVFDNPSDAGRSRREETVELIKLLAGEYCSMRIVRRQN